MTKTILVLDDDEFMRQITGLVLNEAGYEMIESCDGSDALDKLGKRKVNLIISDVNMQSMDGIAFVKAVRALPNHKVTPIIMLSVGFSNALRQEALEAGVKAWMVKPFDKDKLLEMVTRFALP